MCSEGDILLYFAVVLYCSVRKYEEKKPDVACIHPSIHPFCPIWAFVHPKIPHSFPNHTCAKTSLHFIKMFIKKKNESQLATCWRDWLAF